MKSLGLAASAAIAVDKAERHRRNSWCRLWNGFVDMPIFRVVAERLNMPLYQVQAFAVRLDSFANRGEPRGYVGDFNAAEFAVALGMPADDAARIFAAFEHTDILWIEQDHVASFYDRNRDRVDNTEKERQQRCRDRKRIRTLLAKLARTGLISAEQRDSVEAILELFADDDLARFLANLRRGMALEQALSTCHSVTSVTSGLLSMKSAAIEEKNDFGFSTGHGGHKVTDRDPVTVTPRADQKFISGVGENNGDNAGGGAVGLPMEEGTPAHLTDPETAGAWLENEGKRIVTERLAEAPTRAEQRIERWLREIDGDAVALAAIIDRASLSDLVVARFLVTISDAVARRRREAHGPQLPLGPALAADNRRRGHG